jgi:hypothetical protein
MGDGIAVRDERQLCSEQTSVYQRQIADRPSSDPVSTPNSPCEARRGRNAERPDIPPRPRTVSLTTKSQRHQEKTKPSPLLTHVRLDSDRRADPMRGRWYRPMRRGSAPCSGRPYDHSALADRRWAGVFLTGACRFTFGMLAPKRCKHGTVRVTQKRRDASSTSRGSKFSAPLVIRHSSFEHLTIPPSCRGALVV